MSAAPSLGLFAPEETAEQLEGLRVALAEDRDISDFEVTVTPRGRTDAESVAAFGEMGVNRLVLLPPPGGSVDDVAEFVLAHAPECLAAAGLPA